MSLPDDIHLNSSLRLERISSEHVRDFMEIYLDKENVQYMDDVIKSWNGDEQKAQSTIREINASEKDFVYFVYVDDQVVGLLGFENISSENEAEIWYILKKQEQGKGIMANVLSEFLKLNQEKHYFAKIFAEIKKENTKSADLVKKLGFRYISSSDIKSRFCYP